jgi:DNA-binding NtrC family response regulator
MNPGLGIDPIVNKKPILSIGKIAVYDKDYPNSPWEQITKFKKIQYDSFANKKDLIQHIHKTDPEIIIINVDIERCLSDFLGFLKAYLPSQLDIFLVSANKNKIEQLSHQKDYKLLTANPQEIIAAIEPVLRNAYIKKSINRFNGLHIGKEIILGQSEKMKELYHSLIKNAYSDKNCIIEGESGTGKSLIAKGLHYFHPERNKLFFNSKDMRTIPSTLFESEMFGYEKGAFTGASKRKEGWFGNTDGTLFLDEIGNCPLEEQAKLLTVIQERKFSKVGSSIIEDLRARLIFGTNENLSEAVKNKRFREDLYYRIGTLKVTTPPLRERKSDIPLLVDHYLDQWNASNGKSRVISKEVKQMLLDYQWPGNVRELSGAVERILQNSDAKIIDSGDLDLEIIKNSEWFSIPFNLNFDPEHPSGSLAEECKKALPLHVEFFEEIKKRGEPSKEVAKEIGVSPSTLSFWLKGVVIDKAGKTRTIPKKYYPIIRNWIDNPTKTTKSTNNSQSDLLHSHSSI